MMRTLLLLEVAALTACEPKLESENSLLSTRRVLAVAGEPAEARAGVPVEFSALVASPESPSGSESISWRWCVAPKPLAENNIVSEACLEASAPLRGSRSASLVAAGNGPSMIARTTSSACSLFGPDTPPGDFRPRGADSTGGYYQPLRVDLLGAEPVLHLQRIQCGLAQAPADLAARFAEQYAPNQNPKLGALSATIDGQPVSFTQIPAGAQVELSVGWSAEDAESYALFDPSSQTLVTRREALHVAWYANTGRLTAESTGGDEQDLALDTNNVWLAPSAPASAQLWLVLRDSRGGVGWATYTLEVGP